MALFGDHDIGKTEAELQQSREQDDKIGWLYGIPAIVVLAGLSIPERALADGISANNVQRCLLTFLFALAVGVPILMVVMSLSRKTSAKTRALMDALRHDLKEAAAKAQENAQRRESQARRQEFETRLANALEMAATEPEVVDVVERAFVATMGESPTELLLADNSHAHLARMATTGDATEGPMCSVGSPDQCPAARRAQVQRFPDSEALDACPKLRGRGSRCAAVCVPVSIMGRTVGVIHAVTEPNRNVEDFTVQDLATLANLSGARVGLLRMMADTQLQAATDSLTGLSNRRSFENQVRTARQAHSTMALVMADLDHFKELNDTYGHDTGDRALRVFAQTLRAALRSEDIVCRYGGEEFAIALPSCSAQDAANMLNALRGAFSSTAAQAGLPTFTASFGVVAVDSAEDLNDALVRADNALFESKVGGRDRVTIGAGGPAVPHRNGKGHGVANGRSNGNGNGNGNGRSAEEPVEEPAGVVVDG